MYLSKGVIMLENNKETADALLAVAREKRIATLFEMYKYARTAPGTFSELDLKSELLNLLNYDLR